MNRAFVGLGSNADHPRERLEQALVKMEAEGLRVAAVATPVWGPYVGPDGKPVPGAPDVLNTVAEVGTTLEPEALLQRLLEIEAEAGRVRGAGPVRTLDLDLLDVEGATATSSESLTLPHPRALQRAFVLGPWAEIAPHALFTEQDPTLEDDVAALVDVRQRRQIVLVHAARLRARNPQEFAVLRRDPPLALPPLGVRADLLVARSWEGLSEGGCIEECRRDGGAGLALVPTMGALHAGHASLVRRARADGKTVLATIFVNPLQFGPQEDFARYPRTLHADLDLLAASGAEAVYTPEAPDLFPPGFSSYVVPEGPAKGFEGDVRPGHFRGVATVVLKLLQQIRPQAAWFGQKDAQQVAVIHRLARDFDLEVALDVGPTVRDEDGLALSSRNRYLSREERAQAAAFPAALEDVALAAAGGEREAARLLEPARARLTAAGLTIDYVALVDADTFVPLEMVGAAPALVVAAVRAGATRLLDNRWVVVP